MRVLTRVYDRGTVIFVVKIWRSLIHIHDSQNHMSLDDTYVSSMCVNNKYTSRYQLCATIRGREEIPIFVPASFDKNVTSITGARDMRNIKYGIRIS